VFDLHTEIDLDHFLEARQYHDVAGRVDQRFDVFDLRVDNSRREAAIFLSQLLVDINRKPFLT